MIRRYYRFVTDSERSLVWRLVGGALALAGAGAGALALALVVLIPFTPSTGDLEELKVQHPTVVKSAGGETIAEFGRLNREWVALSEMDPTVAQALVVTEDHRFYEHPGVDPKRLAGAVFRTLLGNRQGGSTLTMQLARNLYPDQIGQSFGPLRKLKEIVTALKIERAYSKDQIIETYLNTVSYLYGAHGIERGAQMYFDKSADKLDAEEAAMLVGMLKATAYYNPKQNPERARQRRNVVLAQMEKRGALTAEEYESLSDAPLGVDFSMPPNRRESEAPHFTERLREHLLRWAEERGYNVYTDGLVVHSTLDARLQAMAEEAVRRQGAALQAVADVGWARESSDLLSESAGPYRRARSGVEGFGYFWRKKDALVNDFIRSTRRFERSVAGDYTAEQALDALRDDEAFMDSLREAKTRLQVGFAAVEPEGAEVRAYVGSRDYEKAPYDHAGIARRQPGSTFKPFVYAAALEEGYDPDDTFEDTPVEIRTAGGNTWRPENAGGTATGKPVSLSDGLAYSKNTITSRVVQEVGAGDVADLARDMGVRRSELDKVPSLALGTSSVTLLEMTNAYATLTRGGRYQEPQFIAQIESRDGQVLRASDPPSERVLSEEVAAQITEMMRGVVTRGTGRAVSDGWGIRADVAGKTGTTQGGADGWFLLMHPQLVAGAWTGFNDPRVAFRTGHWGQGGNNALRVTAHFFQQALRSGALSPEEELAPPPASKEDAGGDAGGDGLWASVGDALESAAASAGRAAASAAESAGRAVVGAVSDWMPGEEAAPPPSRRADNRSGDPSSSGEDGRRDAPADGSREEEPSAEQEQAQPRTWNETADERRKRMEEYWKEVQDERRRETERRRERLEQYYEETKENVEEAVPEDLPSPPGRDDRDDRGDEAPPAERRGEDQQGAPNRRAGERPENERRADDREPDAQREETPPESARPDTASGAEEDRRVGW